jgi:hypothetical protein
MKKLRIMYAPDHGGQNVKGGGSDSDPSGTWEEEIADALGQTFPARGRAPGTADPGVPGSRTNPVRPGREPQLESDKPVGPERGSAAGS